MDLECPMVTCGLRHVLRIEHVGGLADEGDELQEILKSLVELGALQMYHI